MSHGITVAVTAEAAHRCPQLGGKCVNIHGHSWRFEVTVAVPKLRPDGTVVDFTRLKRALRDWIDQHLDHTTMLGAADPLLPALIADGTRVLVFGDTHGRELTHDLPWPTAEAVAVLLGRITERLLGSMGETGARHGDGALVWVAVHETAANSAWWSG
jgi:6-pyruvoyltetrahydropterin/6-carboxytetrahydropterin synthase